MIMPKSGIVSASITLGALVVAALAIVAAWKSQSALRVAEAEIAQLRAENQAAGQDRPAASATPSPAPMPQEGSGQPRRVVPVEPPVELLRQLGAMAQLQSNTFAMVQMLVDKAAETDSPQLRLKQQATAISVLEVALNDHQQKVAAARRRIEEQRTTLQVPDDVIPLNPETGLALASLRQYWPYLEAKRDLDNAERAVESLQRRLRQQRIDASGGATNGVPAN